MQTLSRTAEKCRKCSNAKNCNNKRMEACALAELPNQASASLTVPLTGLSALSMSNPVTPITIKMGEYGDIHTTLEEINKNIAKSLMLNTCYLK